MEIEWPCELSQETKEMLMGIARELDAFPRTPAAPIKVGLCISPRVLRRSHSAVKAPIP